MAAGYMGQPQPQQQTAQEVDAQLSRPKCLSRKPDDLSSNPRALEKPDTVASICDASPFRARMRGGGEESVKPTGWLAWVQSGRNKTEVVSIR